MRLVDADKLYPDVMKVDGSMAISQGQLAHAKTIEAIPKADYESRLKADLVDMLEDLRLDFQEAELAAVFDNKELIFADEVDDLVQQKINTLKGDQAAG